MDEWLYQSYVVCIYNLYFNIDIIIAGLANFDMYMRLRWPKCLSIYKRYIIHFWNIKTVSASIFTIIIPWQIWSELCIYTHI